MVTAETAVVLPVLLMVLAGAVSALIVVGAQLRCVDAAREGARAAARGDGDAAVTAIVARSGPAGARVRIATGTDDIAVTVSADVAPLGPVPLHVRVSSRAVSAREPSAGDPAAVGGPG
jgi:Flp pilus assembly protein TadG